MLTCVGSTAALLWTLVLLGVHAEDMDPGSDEAIKVAHFAVDQLNIESPDHGFRLIGVVSVNVDIGDDGNDYLMQVIIEQTSCSIYEGKDLGNAWDCPKIAGANCEVNVYYSMAGDAALNGNTCLY